MGFEEYRLGGRPLYSHVNNLFTLAIYSKFWLGSGVPLPIFSIRLLWLEKEAS